MTTVAVPDPGCPTWCDCGAGHDLEVHQGLARRIHLGPLHRGSRLEQFETVAADGGLVRGPVQVASDHGRKPVTVREPATAA